MPYIDHDARHRLWKGDSPQTVGELNYAITGLCNEYLFGKKSYTTYNEVIGVLECAKLELYRRMVAPYEDAKRIENGEVYDI